MQDLTEIIGRLGARLEKLEAIKDNDDTKSKFIVNPLGSDVVQAYDTLLQQNEHLNHPCCCCGVEAEPGVPWYPPYNIQHRPNDDPLQDAYTHWCTLMRCLPTMDAEAQTYVRTIGHYAMRQLMHAMRTRYVASSPLQRHNQYQGSAHTLLSNMISSNNGSSSLAPVLLKNSSSCLTDKPQETTLRTKADAWVPQQRRLDESNYQQPIAPVPNSTSSPLPSSSNTFFTSPLSNRPTKLRRWFKRHNKVAPHQNNHS